MPVRFNDFPSELIHAVFKCLAEVPAPAEDWLDPQSFCHDHVVPCVSVIYSPDEHYAKVNLAACSLVCVTWYTISRPLLFETLALRFSGSSQGARTLVHISQWLDGSPDVRSFVKELRLVSSYEDCGDGAFPIPLNYNAAQLSKVLFSLPSVQTVKLVDVRIDQFSKVKLAKAFSRSGPPRYLNLDKFHYIFNKCSPSYGLQSLQDLLYLMTWLGDVRELHIGYVPLLVPTKPIAPSKVPCTLRLRSVDIEGDMSIRLFIDSLHICAKVNLSTLQNFSVNVHVLDQTELSDVPSLFNSIAHSDRLTLNLVGLFDFMSGSTQDIPDSVPPFSLRTFSKLRSITLEIPVAHTDFMSVVHEQLVWTHVSNILSTTPTPSMEEVTLLLEVRGSATIREIVEACSTRMKCIDEVMCNLPKLKKFKIAKHGGPADGQESKYVNAAFEGLRIQDALEYEPGQNTLELWSLSNIPFLQGFGA